MKHMRHWLMTAVLLLCSITASANDFEVDGIYYEITNSTTHTVGVTFRNRTYNSYSGNVTIPSTVTYDGQTYSVTSIEAYAFYNCSSLTSIIIPESVTSIEIHAFAECSRLTSITIPKGVISLDRWAFDCSSLTSIVVVEGNTVYDSRDNCNAIIETSTNTLILGCGSTIIPNTISKIGNSAFADCSNLTSMNIPEGVTSIGYNAFYGCSNLTSIILPGSVTSIADYTFSHCTNLTSMNIPKGVTEIGPYAFSCSGLTSITIPESVTSIGDYAFNGCSNLTSIIIPESVTYIGYGLFWNCTSLSSITIPESVTSIKNHTFSNCSNLTSINISKGVTEIDSDVFEGCSSLTSVYISSLEAWCNIDFSRDSDSNPLSYAENLYLNGEPVTELVIPNTWTKIKDYVFSGYKGLTSITCEATTPITIGANTFSDKSIPVYVPSASVKAYQEAYYWSEFTNIQSDCIGSGECGDNLVWTLTRDGELIIEGTGPMNDYYWAPWSYYSESIKKVTIKDGVTSIGNSAFEDCSSLTSISIPEGVTAIGEYAISGCDNLVSVYIPKSVTEIGLGAFAYNSSLSSIVVDEGNTVYDSRNNCNAIIETSSNTLIQGFPITVIPNTVKTIGCYAFEGYRNLPSITIPEGVTTIEKGAFEESNLTSITIPESVVEIKGQALHSTPWYDNQPDGAIYCGKVLYAYKGTMPANTSIEVKEGTKGIADNAFEYCSNLTSITIPESVMSIGECAFEDCSNLTNVKLPENITRIEASTFEDCYNLASISIPKHVESIGARAFGYSGITSIVIPEDVTSIEGEAFRGCFYLTSITIPKGVTSIGGEAFTECVNLASITCETDIPPTIGYSSPFEGVEKSIPVYVPASSISAYQTAEYWKEFTNIQPLATDYDNTLSIDDMEARSGEQAVLSVNLENVVDITNLQFDLVLPEGITIAQDEDGYELIDLSTERTTARKHTIGNEVQADGSMRILCYSSSNAVFNGTEGEVLTVTLDIDKSVKEGDYTVRMKNLVLTEYTDGNPIKHTVPSVEATISVYAYTPGDVNDDGAIDVTDISGVVNFILNTASDGLQERAADVNDDGAVDVTDISGVVNLILNASATAATSSARDMLRSATTANGSDIRVTVLPFTLEAGEEKEIYVLLDNPGDAFTGIQLDLHMPEGISVPVDGDGYYYVDLGSRTTSRKHVLPECSVQEDGSLRVLCYSNSNALFSGEEGDVLVITVAGDEDLTGGVYEMALKNVVLSRPDVTNYKPADYAASVLSGDAGEETTLTLKGIYTKEVLGQFSAALANNSAITSVDLTAGIEVDNTATLTTGNPNTIVYLAEGDALANESNVVIGDECAGLVLTDGYAFAAPVAFSASQASYGRELAEEKYGTIVLPYAPDTDEYVFYALTSAGDDVLIFDEVETPAANTPYLYKLRDGKSATRVTGSEVAVSSELTPAVAASWQMVGSYANRVIAAGEDGDRYYYAYTSSDNKIHQVTNTLTVKPYRAYFTTASTVGTQLAIRTRGGEETLIDVTEVDGLCPEVYYDLSGRRVDNPAEGVYIVNGKKVVF